MRYYAIFSIWLSCYSVGYALNDTTTQGNCSPIVSGEVGGSVTITCQGLSEGAVKTLNELLNKIGEVKGLNNLVLEKLGKLDKIEKDLAANQGMASELVTLNQEKRKLEDDIKSLQEGIETAKLKAADEWIQKYRELEKQLAEEIGDELAEQAQQALEKGDLDQAGQLLDQLIKKREQQVEKAAKAHYLRAQAFALQYKPLEALLHLEKAYRYRPENTEYAGAYAYLLRNQNQHAAAITIYEQNLARLREKGDKPNVAATLNNLGHLYGYTQRLKEGEASYQEALTIYRDLANANPSVYLPEVASTLKNLGTLYHITQRFKAGEASYQEALTTYRDLAKANPSVYLPDVATTLNNLGLLYSVTQRFKAGEASHQEALTIRRDLAKANPSAYLPAVADTLNDLATLYWKTPRLKEAEARYQEVLSIRRVLTKANPQAYLPDVATMLYNLGLLYRNTQRLKEKEASYQEALTIYRDLAEANPQDYLPYVARMLNNLGNLYQVTQRFKEGEASFQEALSIRRDLAEANPQDYLPVVASTLNNLGLLYKETQRFKEGEASFQEALSIRRDLAKANPSAYLQAAYLQAVANTLHNFALLYFEQEKKGQAHPYFKEETTIRRELWKAYPELYADKFAANLFLNALTLLQEEAETRCSLLTEAFKVARSAELKMEIMTEDKKQGGRCKLHNLMLKKSESE